MNTNRQAATLVGVLFIIATVTAMPGLLFYQPILSGPDYLINGAGHQNQVILGALMELILVCTAIGLFPVLRPYGERIALGHHVRPVRRRPTFHPDGSPGPAGRRL